jgi:hypothetical protein
MTAMFLLATPAGAQSLGVRAGVSANPEQFYFGGHVETRPLVERVHFRPNVEIGVGSNTTISAFNVEFAYRFTTSRPWHVYAGGGPALNVISRRGNTNSEAGFNFLIGIQHEDGLLAEFKLGVIDSPDVKFGVGYAVRWR